MIVRLIRKQCTSQFTRIGLNNDWSMFCRCKSWRYFKRTASLRQRHSCRIDIDSTATTIFNTAQTINYNVSKYHNTYRLCNRKHSIASVPTKVRIMLFYHASQNFKLMWDSPLPRKFDRILSSLRVCRRIALCK